MSSRSENAAGWHAERRARILRAHPEIRALFGPHPATAWLVVLLSATQLGLASFSSVLSWPLVLVSAYVIGAVVAHALGVLIHECAHNLTSRTTRANKAWGLVANLGLLAPAAMEFRAQHLLHHAHLGDVDGRDTQAPSRMEARVVGGGALRKILSFTLGRFYYPSRPANRVATDAWMLANWALVLGVDAVLLGTLGPKPIVFLAVAGLSAFGPHPLGARRLSEHFLTHTEQPTHSYYGPWNAVSFHVGYHVEHHDFPAVAWARLPALRAALAHEYAELHAFRSWTRLLWRYFFDRRYRVEQYVGMGPPNEIEERAFGAHPVARASASGDLVRSPPGTQTRPPHR